MIEAVYLAHEIEWAHARERALLIHRARRDTRRKFTKDQIFAEFDPHAATELAELIERRLGPWWRSQAQAAGAVAKTDAT